MANALLAIHFESASELNNPPKPRSAAETSNAVGSNRCDDEQPGEVVGRGVWGSRITGGTLPPRLHREKSNIVWPSIVAD
jgi:hypothetical protein